jgi:hypothetical protein
MNTDFILIFHLIQKKLIYILNILKAIHGMNKKVIRTENKYMISHQRQSHLYVANCSDLKSERVGWVGANSGRLVKFG